MSSSRDRGPRRPGVARAAWHVALLGLMVLPGATTWGQRPPAAGSCREDPAFARLDFWVGEWQVYVGSELAGTDHVEKLLDGCAISEVWSSTRGGSGRSLFYVDPASRRWKQVWVTATARTPGGVKEKVQVDPLPGGAIRFQGEVRDTSGRAWLDRTTLTPRADGTVHQLIEVSADGGASWRTTFDAVFRRAQTAPAGSQAPPQDPAAALDLIRGGGWPEAAQAYARLAEANPHPGTLEYHLGLAEARRGECGRAVAPLGRAIALGVDGTAGGMRQARVLMPECVANRYAGASAVIEWLVRPVVFSTETLFRLPLSGLSGSVSARIEVKGPSADDLRPWSPPHLAVWPTPSQLEAGEDPVLEAALHRIRTTTIPAGRR